MVRSDTLAAAATARIVGCAGVRGSVRERNQFNAPKVLPKNWREDYLKDEPKAPADGS